MDLAVMRERARQRYEEEAPAIDLSVDALEAAIVTGNWEYVADALVMLELEIERRTRRWQQLR